MILQVGCLFFLSISLRFGPAIPSSVRPSMGREGRDARRRSRQCVRRMSVCGDGDEGGDGDGGSEGGVVGRERAKPKLKPRIKKG